MKSSLKNVTEDCNPFEDEGEAVDKTGWCNYERIWKDDAGNLTGGCRWSAPPPMEGEWRSDIMIYDEVMHKMVLLPAGFAVPFLPNDDPDW